MSTARDPSKPVRSSRSRNALARSVVLVAVLASAGCGGVSGDTNCTFFSNRCEIDSIVFPPVLLASVYPMRRTVQVGGSVTFGANVPASGVAFQWRRSSDNGATWVDIAGATGQTYTLAGAQLPDDGSLFGVQVTSGTDSVAAFPGRLTVSSMPGVGIADGEFRIVDWAATQTPLPAAGGTTETVEQVLDGGQPGAYRRMVDAIPGLPGSLLTLHVFQGAAYDPAVQGGVHVVDYTEDCRLVGSTAGATVGSSLLVEQDGRTYASPPDLCVGTGWQGHVALASLGAAQLTQIAGPACPVGAACPDFGATGLPMRFGYVRSVTVTAGTPPVTLEHQIDNWRVTVWRR